MSVPTTPALTPSGSLLMKIGLLANMEGDTGVFITPATRAVLKLELGAYVEVRSADHGTCVNRAVRSLSTTSEVRNEYVYLDGESLRYLSADLHDVVEIVIADLQLDVP